MADTSSQTYLGDRLVIATHNRGKLTEFRAMLAPFFREIVSAGELDLPEPMEDGETFRDNALIKARAAAQAAGCVALADDSGLCVNALGGQPGVHTARWCGPEKSVEVGMHAVHDALGCALDRSAYFIASLAMVWPDGRELCVEGRCDGQMIWPPRGNKGHGYDPSFVPDDGDGLRTFGEMEEEEKDSVSHRARACRLLLEKLKDM
jgi:XTP/dITP diphosphohydrolase